MELSVSNHVDYVLAKTSGAIDDTAGDAFREHVHPTVGQGSAKVIVDLSDSPRINSAGIACLVRLVTDANTHHSRVIFAAPAPFVNNVFSVTKLHRFFEIVDTIAEAESRLRKITT